MDTQPRPLRRRLRAGWARIATWSSGTRSAVVTALILVVVLGIALGYRQFTSPGDDAGLAEPSFPTSEIFRARIAENPPVGTCVATRAGWDTTPALVACTEPHWGEIAGYPSLTPGPAPYPGVEQSSALAHYLCLATITRFSLPGRAYATAQLTPGRERWNSGRWASDNYTTCVLHAADDKGLPQVSLTARPLRAADDPLPVAMPPDPLDITVDPPVGTCVLDPPIERGFRDLQVVPCTRQHWAQVLGYPVVFSGGSLWPGIATVKASAVSACDGLRQARGNPPGIVSTDVLLGFDERVDQPPAGVPQLRALCLAQRADNTSFTGPIG